MKKILDNTYYDFIINNNIISKYDTGDNITMLNEWHSVLHIKKINKEPCDLGLYPYHFFPSVYTLTAKINAGKTYNYSFRQNPISDFNGLGVIIGIIDTGVDYQHPAFVNPDGTTRILSIWDQTSQNGKPPKGFSFGSEYSKNHINAALISPDPLALVPTVDTSGHGTAIASIISGSPNADHSFTGIAPQTKLAVVKLKEAKHNLKKIFFIPEDTLCYQESDIILGIRYLLSVSEKLKRPLVICLALGSSQGSHDGQSPISSYLDYLVHLPGIDVIAAAGNEGNNYRHYFYNSAATSYCSDIYLKTGGNDKMLSMEIWPALPGKLSIEFTAPNQEFIGSVYPSMKGCQKFSLACNKTTVWINNVILHGAIGNQLIIVRFDNPIPGIWHFRVKNINQEPFSFHSWLPSGNLISNETYFFQPAPDTTITSPGNTRFPLTVTAYNQLELSILEESGRGYTRQFQINPDAAAPGYQIPCAVPGNQYGIITGTGAAAAYAAASAAMVMEWGFCKGNHTGVTGNQVNRIIKNTAQRNSICIYPNNIWGYGLLDVCTLSEHLSTLRLQTP